MAVFWVLGSPGGRLGFQTSHWAHSFSPGQRRALMSRSPSGRCLELKERSPSGHNSGTKVETGADSPRQAKLEPKVSKTYC